MVQDDPTKRPSMDEVVDRFNAVRAQLSVIKLRSRISRRGEPWLKRLFRGIPHIIRTVKYTYQGLPAVPTC